jgi:growth factor-regulated tyrosine kinase substrate
MPLPQLGINEYVRVCDGCYIKLKLDKATMAASTSTTTASTTTAAITSNIVPKSTTSTTVNNNNHDDFDDDIKKAIELSLKEAEQQKNSFGAGYVAPTLQKEPQQQQEPVEDDPDLAAAIAASLRDIEISKQQPQQPAVRKDELSPVEMENILLFSTLMDRVYATGGDVSNDTQINQLYTQIGTLQPKLVKNLDETIRKRNAFIELHEKLNMAVRAYDRLLEERIAGVRQQQQQQQQNSYYNIPEQNYQQQPLYHQQYNQYQQQQQQQQQQDTNKYYPQQQPEYYNNQPATAVEYPPVPNNQDMSNYYSAPPLHYHVQSPAVTEQQQKKPVDEAPLIEL